MKGRGRFLVVTITITVIALVVVLLLALIVVPPLLAPRSVSLPFKAGMRASYATGSSSFATFTLQRSAVLTGAFVTNESATVSIAQVSTTSPQDACQNLNGYCYTTGNVNRATIDVTLPAGTYKIIINFTNDATVQTWFNVTQSFIATYRS